MLRLRVRFPDGRSDTLDGIAADTTYADFCKRTLADMPHGRPVELLLAGPPARRVELTEHAPIGTLLRSGDTLLVSYAPTGSDAKPFIATPVSAPRGGSSRGRGGVINGSARGRGGRGRARGARRKAAAFANAGRGHGLGDAVDESATDPLGAVGAALVRTVAGNAAADPARRSVQESLRLAREAREREADGERRYGAFLAGKYEVEYFRLQGGGDGALTFRVRYLPPGYRVWREDPPREEDVYSAWSTRLLGAVLKCTLDADKDDKRLGGDDNDKMEAREGLRPHIMAYQSPRMFWNLVRHFGADMESKMRALVPDADWTFMNSRKRRLSEKAKRNLENERLFKKTGATDK